MARYCPDCQGGGSLSEVHPFGSTTTTEHFTCDTCHGTGAELSQEEQDMLEEAYDHSLSKYQALVDELSVDPESDKEDFGLEDYREEFFQARETNQ